MSLVKAEILWTRKCPLNCSYCNMNTGRGNSRSVSEWKAGMDELKKLGTSFAAFYGAEPLSDMEGLGEVVGYAQSIGIETSIITSGQVPNFHVKLVELHKAGARSISMSYDMVPLGVSSAHKMSNAIEGLEFFKSLGCRDVAAIATLTRKNYMHMIETIKILSAKGIWFFFDIIHPDRGQLGSKCKGSSEELLFRPDDIPELYETMLDVGWMQEEGYLVHNSKHFTDLLFANNGNALINFNWNCGVDAVFPSWVTIDCDGLVYYCDDYQEKTSKFDMTSLADNWNRFVKKGKDSVKRCRGCCWNTHIDAHAIKSGVSDIKDYVHGLEN